MENRKNFDVKRLRQQIAQSSKDWLTKFLADDTSEKEQQAETLEKLLVAHQNKSLVVLQVAKKNGQPPFETLTGFIGSGNFNSGTVVLRPLVSTEALQLISLPTIKKIAVQGVNFPARTK